MEMLKQVVGKLVKNKEAKNAGWIIAGKIGQMALNFFVGLWTARYLGPSNYGLISYVAAYIAFFTSFCTLGITSAIIINDFTEHPDEEGKALGSAMVLRLISSFLSAILIVCIVFIIDHDEPTTILIAVLSSIALLFKVLDSLEYWFQKRLLSKITSIAVFAAYCISSLYKVILLVSGQSVYMSLWRRLLIISLLPCFYILPIKSTMGQSSPIPGMWEKDCFQRAIILSSPE